MSDNLPLGVTPATVLGLCFIHFILPVIHYIHVKCCKGTKSRVSNHRRNISSIDVENQYAISEEEAKDILKADASFTRVVSMHWTLGTYAWIIYFVVTSFMDEIFLLSVCNILGYIFIPLFGLFLWLETFLSWEYGYLSNIYEEKSCKDYIQELREQKPELQIYVGAYHFETRTRQYYRYDANGNSTLVTETYQERVQDYRETVMFRYQRWRDCSPKPNTLILDPGKLTRVKMQKYVLLGDDATKDTFNRVMDELEAKVRAMFPSSMFESSTEQIVPGFESRICSYWDMNEKKWWANKCLYLTLSLLVLTWFYRIPFTLATQATCYRVVKKIYTS